MDDDLKAYLEAMERRLLTQMDAHQEELMEQFDATDKAVASLAAAMASTAALLTRLENNQKI